MHFDLDEVGFEEFCGICDSLGKPRPSRFSERHGRNTKPKRFFRIKNSVVYGTFQNLVSDVRGGRYLKCVWFPEGDIPIGEATYRMSITPRGRLIQVFEEENMYDSAVVQVSKSQRRSRYDEHTDGFDFKKHDGVWALRYFMISSANLGWYTFNRAAPDSVSVRTIHGVYVDSAI